MNFKPTKWKVVVSILAVVLWVILSSFLVMYCKMCQEYSCDIDYYSYYLASHGCKCDCGSFSGMLLSNLLSIIIPFLIIYIIWSLIEKPSKKKGKRK